ncbi:MAG TPA: glycosyltransferase family 9 protein [Burkholderiales bacterium]|nr:glycosyltransferase family 9 protein [Burkholderiales bacterium]
MAAPDSRGALAPNARVLVVHVARIGDTLLITPALRALKQAIPTGRLGCLLHPARRELLEGLPFIDELGAITPKTAWWRGRLNVQHWDMAVVYGHDAALIRYAARVAERVVAFDQHDETLDAMLWKAVPTPTAPMHAVHERLLLPAAFGIETRDYRLAYAPSAPELAAAKDWLARHTVATRPLVGFQVASFQTKSYRDWPLDRFIELGRRLLARHPEARILVFGGNESRGHADTLARALGVRVISLAGALRLRVTAALMAQLDLYVGVDTGPTHLAGALRVPMVALYHCRHRGRYLAPLQHEHLRVLEHPATDDDCRTTLPMSDITVDQVWNAVESLPA